MSELADRLDDLAYLFRHGPFGEAGIAAFTRLGLQVDSRFQKSLEGLTDSQQADEWGALHQSLFGFNVFPFASVFLDEEGKMGGAVEDYVARTYARERFIPSGGDDSGHLVSELQFCAFLLRKTDKDSELITRFLDEHVFAWLPCFVFALERRTDGFFAALAARALSILVDVRNAADFVVETEHFPDASKEQESPASIRALAGHCVSAVRAGLFLSRADISELARSVQVPTGFGSREQMFTTLFDSARTYGKESNLIDALDSMMEVEHGKWTTLADSNVTEAVAKEEVTTESIGHWAAVWQSRLEHTRLLLKQTSDLT